MCRPLLTLGCLVQVLTECPLIVMLLFQLYPRYIQTTIPSLIPKMVQTLALRPTVRAPYRFRLACADFMAAQVKTLSFLTYLLRAYADVMRPYQESIPKCVIQLLLTCPPESVSIRKDILVATRHILATDFRSGFTHQIDVLLDEKVQCKRPAMSTSCTPQFSFGSNLHSNALSEAVTFIVLGSYGFGEQCERSVRK